MAKSAKQPSRAKRLSNRREPSGPKTTRPAATSRRPGPTASPGFSAAGRKLDAAPDRVDIRDWFYRPNLAPLPDRVVNCDHVPMILDQGNEGACTGYALAAVINFLRAHRFERDSVSPQMLYDMARRYDEWPGENYEGSSARGAMKGWVRHGVCLNATWPSTLKGAKHLTPERADEARLIPGGAFYRVMHREPRDMHAALADVGILYLTLMVHDGWDQPSGRSVTVTYSRDGHDRRITLPVIERKGAAANGHAVAIVGYTGEGFIIQNSWGDAWGERGFALLPYEDYLIHATDVWVAQLGVPLTVDLWQRSGISTAGIQRAGAAIPLADIRPYTIDIGNNGLLSDSGDYWTKPEDVDRMFQTTIPEATANWQKKRVMLYLHGGLNGEDAVARRVVAFRDTLLANEIYPIHIMWESGLMETLRNLLEDLLTGPDARAGAVADWLKRTRDNLVGAKDWTLELTLAGPGSALWSKMKENSRRASAKGGGMQLVAKSVARALAPLSATERQAWEVHVVGHSAGSIFAADTLALLTGLGVNFKTVQFMAPAVTVRQFKDALMPVVSAKTCPVPLLYVLSDVGERDDDVGPYGKSLLYLVSNAFEGARSTPLLGMQKFIMPVASAVDAAAPDPDVEKLLKGRIVVAGERPASGTYPYSQSDSHGGFDNDVATMNSVIWHILGAAPKKAFTSRDLQY